MVPVTISSDFEQSNASCELSSIAQVQISSPHKNQCAMVVLQQFRRLRTFLCRVERDVCDFGSWSDNSEFQKSHIRL